MLYSEHVRCTSTAELKSLPSTRDRSEIPGIDGLICDYSSLLEAWQDESRNENDD